MWGEEISSPQGSLMPRKCSTKLDKDQMDKAVNMSDISDKSKSKVGKLKSISVAEVAEQAQVPSFEQLLPTPVLTLEEKEKLETTIDELQQQVVEFKELALRTAADFENFRKRNQDELIRQRDIGREKVVVDLIPALDGLAKAVNLCQCGIEPNKLKEGLNKTLDLLNSILSANGIAIIGRIGDAFDPNIHQAIAKDECDLVGDEVIAEVYQQGITLNGRTLKPALVKVGIRPAADES